MKQKQYAPMSVAEMALSIYAVNNGYFDKVDAKKVVDFEAALQAFAKTNHKATLDAINAEPVLKKHEATLKKICEDFVDDRHVLTERVRCPAQRKSASRSRASRARRRSPRPCRWWRPARCVAPRSACAWRVRTRDKIRAVIGHLTQANPDYRHPFLVERARSKNVGIIVISHRSRPLPAPQRQHVQARR